MVELNRPKNHHRKRSVDRYHYLTSLLCVFEVCNAKVHSDRNPDFEEDSIGTVEELFKGPLLSQDRRTCDFVRSRTSAICKWFLCVLVDPASLYLQYQV